MLPVRDAVMKRESEVLSSSIWWTPSIGLSHLAEMESPWPQGESSASYCGNILFYFILFYFSRAIRPTVSSSSAAEKKKKIYVNFNKVAASFKLCSPGFENSTFNNSCSYRLYWNIHCAQEGHAEKGHTAKIHMHRLYLNHCRKNSHSVLVLLKEG